MKKIIITSSGFLKKAPRDQIQLSLPPKDFKKVAYITTASKVVKQPEYAQKEKDIMTELGYQVTEIDLEITQGIELEKKLRDSEFVYVQGGNPYWLLKNARESGFMEIMPTLIENGIPYLGKSAGAYILAPEVLPPTWYKKEWRKFGVENMKGMGVVKFVWAAHFDPEDQEMKEDIELGIKKSPFPVRVITNDQGFIIEDDNVKFFGIGEEFLLDKRVENEDKELKHIGHEFNLTRQENK